MRESPPNLDQLLDQLASEPVPVDPRHRYALRSALLHSAVFDSNRVVTRWFHVLSVTGTALAGSFVVAVVIVSVSVASPVGSMMNAGVQVAEVESITREKNEYSARGRNVLPAVRVVDFSEFVTKENVDKWVAAPDVFVASR